MNKTYLLALALSTIAGLSTSIGGLITFFIKKNSMRVLSLGLGFSAGVMIFISLGDLFPQASEMILKTFGPSHHWLVLLFFFLGMLIAILIDYFTPDHVEGKLFSRQVTENTVENCGIEESHNHTCPKDLSSVKKAGLVTALAVTVHNFPEGLTTFFATTTSLKLGLSIVLAIAIHNIPEGIAISLPIYQATGSKRKALLYTSLSGLAEPLGGVMGFALIKILFPQMTLGIMFALVAGIMTYISFDTLLPLSREYDTGHYSITGVVLGMLFIGLSLVLF